MNDKAIAAFIIGLSLGTLAGILAILPGAERSRREMTELYNEACAYAERAEQRGWDQGYAYGVEIGQTRAATVIPAAGR